MSQALRPNGEVVAAFRGEDKLWRLCTHDRPVVWLTRKGVALRLDEMTSDHIRNCLANVLFIKADWRTAYIGPLTEELSKRGD